jgi:hypothetical protein
MIIIQQSRCGLVAALSQFGKERWCATNNTPGPGRREGGLQKARTHIGPAAQNGVVQYRQRQDKLRGLERADTVTLSELAMIAVFNGIHSRRPSSIPPRRSGGAHKRSQQAAAHK